jgi:hypothetical protein
VGVIHGVPDLLGSQGVSMCRTPKLDSASSTALATAAGAATVGNSPTPDPERVHRRRVSIVSVTISGNLAATGSA